MLGPRGGKMVGIGRTQTSTAVLSQLCITAKSRPLTAVLLLLCVTAKTRTLSTSVLDCAETGQIYNSQDGQCYIPTSQGPCESDSWFVLTNTTVEGSCVARQCASSGQFLQVLHSGRCKAISEVTACKEVGEVLFPNVYGVGVCDCDDGWYRHTDKSCYQEFTKGWCRDGQVLKRLDDLPAPAECRTTQNSENADAPCVFPFRHKGYTYDGCTDEGEDEDKVFLSHWCSTKVNQRGDHVIGEGQWGFCRSNCPQSGHPLDGLTGILFPNVKENLLLVDIISQKTNDKLVCVDNPCGDPEQRLMWYDGECHDVFEPLDGCEVALDDIQFDDYDELNEKYNKLFCFQQYETFSVGPAFNTNIRKKNCRRGKVWNPRRKRCVRSYRG